MGDIHEGAFLGEKKLTKHFNLSHFKCKCGCNRYKYSDKLLAKLEAMFINYPVIKSFEITSSYRSGGGTSQHAYGKAVDIKWRDQNGQVIDARYIACGAKKIGFTGVAPLHNNDGTFTITHMDVRDTPWYFCEQDLTPPWGWFETYTAVPNFFTFYGLNETDVFKYLGGDGSIVPGGTVDNGLTTEIALPPSILQLHETSANFRIFFERSNLGTAFYKYKQVDSSDEVTSNVGQVDAETEYLDFELTDLVPGTEYKITVGVNNTDGSDTSTSPEITFSTLQSYPKITINSVFLTSAHDNTDFQLTFRVPTTIIQDWGHWHKKGLGTQRGFFINYFINGESKGQIKKISLNPNTDSYSLDFSLDSLLENEDTLQIGIQPYIVVAGKTIKDAFFQYFSNPLSLKIKDVSRDLYLRDTENLENTPIPLMIYSEL
jgi:hypothetical protein